MMRKLLCWLGFHGRPVLHLCRKPLFVKVKATDGSLVGCYRDILQCERCNRDIGTTGARPG
jgi:hypothetical protein